MQFIFDKKFVNQANKVALGDVNYSIRVIGLHEITSANLWNLVKCPEGGG